MRSMGREEQVTIDRLAAEELGLGSAILMEHAALALAREIRKMNAQTVSFICGRGNNGGDAYAAARLLLNDIAHIRVFEEADVVDRLSEDAALNRSILINLGLEPLCFDQYESIAGEIVVDALFGTAFTLERGMPAAYERILNCVQASRENMNIRVLAVDVPSGVEANSGLVHPATLRADSTLSFIYPKTGILSYPGRKYAGDIHQDFIGLPRSWIDKVWQASSFTAALALDQEFFEETMVRPLDSHKGSNGRVCIMAGSPGMGGAAILATRAAICGGSGLVRLAIPESLYSAALSAVPSALIERIPLSPDTQVQWWQEKMKGQDAVAIGPGMGSPVEGGPRLFEFLIEAIMTAPRLVIDADGLNLLALPQFIDFGRAALRLRVDRGLEAAVLTPHPGEAKRLLSIDANLALEDRLTAAKRLAELWSSVVVLKGAGTVIAFPNDPILFINTSGNPGLGKGGSGDLLTGLLTSFLGQGLTLHMAVCGAVYLHGLAADLAAAKRGCRALMPDELLDYLPAAYRTVQWQ